MVRYTIQIVVTTGTRGGLNNNDNILWMDIRNDKCIRVIGHVVHVIVLLQSYLFNHTAPIIFSVVNVTVREKRRNHRVRCTKVTGRVVDVILLLRSYHFNHATRVTSSVSTVLKSQKGIR